METIELTLDDPRSGRWLRVIRDERRVEVCAGTTRIRRGDGTRRRVRTTAWEIARTPAGPVCNLLEPVRRSAMHALGGSAADLGGLLQLSGASGDGLAELDRVAQLAADVLGYPDDGPGREHGLTGVLTGATYPLLDASMRAGNPPPPTVPAPVAPYLRAPTARDAAERAFGRRANRPVVRALAQSLAPADGTAAPLEPLATAVIGATVLPPERIAELLDLRPAHPGAVVLAAREVATGQELLGRLHPTVGHRLLVEAVETPEGPGLLVEVLARWSLVGRPEPPQRVRTLRGLLDALADLPLALDPTPRPRPAPAQPPERRAGPAPDPRPARVAAPRAAPDPYPPDVRALGGAHVGPFVIDVPTDPQALVGWGRAMENCLGGYRQAVASGASHVIGYRRAGRLVYAVEISRDRWVRQFEGPGAARPAPTDAALIVGHLQRAGVLHHDAARRRPGRQLAPPM